MRVPNCGEAGRRVFGLQNANRKPEDAFDGRTGHPERPVPAKMGTYSLLRSRVGERTTQELLRHRQSHVERERRGRHPRTTSETFRQVVTLSAHQGPTEIQ